MRCAARQADDRTGQRFCAACGAALEAPCPACRFANHQGERLCGGCDARPGTDPAVARPNLGPAPGAHDRARRPAG